MTGMASPAASARPGDRQPPSVAGRRGPAAGKVIRRYHVGVPFLICVGLAVLVALSAMNSGSNQLYWIFGILAAGLLISIGASGLMAGGLSVRRICPPNGVVDEPLTVRYALDNRRRLVPAFDISCRERRDRRRDGWDRCMAPVRAWVMHIGPRETVHGEATFWPTQRGVARFDMIRVSTTFPFGIIGRSLTFSQPHRALIFPRRYPLRPRVLEAIAPGGPVGMKVSQHAGAGDDFYGLREMRPGDSLRHIAWKRTANRDQLLCVERTRPCPPKLRIVLSLTQPTADLDDDLASARRLEEDAISLAASIVHAADLAGFEIGLSVIGAEAPDLPISRSHWHRNRIMSVLAEIDLNAARSPGGDLPAAERAGIVVVHPGRPDLALASPEAWHFSASQMDHLVERDTDSPGDRADAAAGEGGA